MSNLVFILISLVLSFSFSFLIIPWGITILQNLKFGKQIRSEWLIGKATEFARMHEGKRWTPTMGGIFIIATVSILILLSVFLQPLTPWLREVFHFEINHSLWVREETYIVFFTLISVGIIGFVDDYLNIREIGKTKWLSARVKVISLIIFGFIGAYWFYFKLGYNAVHVPFIGGVTISFLYIPLFILIFVSAANSVNITDGLDGLAWWLLLFQYAAYGFIAYSKELYILSAFCLIIAGALMAFLWFNIHPAKIFMGDVGSLSLGATLAVIAMMTDTLLAFIVMSGIFIFETISVIIQMTSKKLRNGKKIFRVAPFHHHLEAIWWQEETIVMRFWLIGMVLSVAWVIISMMGN